MAIADVYPKLLHTFELMTLLGIETQDHINMAELPPEDTKTDEKVGEMIHKKLEYYRTKRAVFDDAFLSFDFAMRNHVFPEPSTGALSEPRKASLKASLELFDKATPTSAWKMKRVVSNLLVNFNNVTTSKDAFVTALNKYPVEPSTWSSFCTAENASTGYMCGLWKLLHVATVGMVEWSKELDGTEQRSISAKEPGDVLRNFVADFSGCPECVESFVKAYDDCEFDRCKRFSQKGWTAFKELPLWFFEIHNKINLQVIKEKAVKEKFHLTEQHIKFSQWPLQRECPLCRKTDGSLIMTNIMLLLRVTYW